MTIDFCYEIQIIISCATVDTIPVDFELDNFMLRGAMTIFKFSSDFQEAFKAIFLFLQHCMPSC